MPFLSKRVKLQMSAEDMGYLSQCSRSRAGSASKVHRGKVLLAYHTTVSTISNGSNPQLLIGAGKYRPVSSLNPIP
jgi:hypothetical protein